MARIRLPLPDFFVGRVAPFRGDAAVLVSGGSDSVALLRLVTGFALGSWRRLRVLHFDHQLRPDSADDANFVCALAEQLRLPCDVIRLDPIQLQRGEGGMQASGRSMRRECTLRYLAQYRLSWALLGHTWDDHSETIVSQILRGRGPQDRKGILPTYGAVVRPLLSVTRLELQQWLQSIGQPWRDDSSNATDVYQRNYLRHHGMTQLAVTGALTQIESQAQHARGLWQRAHAYLMQHTGASPATAVACRMPETGDLLTLSVCALWAGYRGVQVSQSQWHRVWQSPAAHQVDVHGGRLCRIGNWLWIVRPQDTAAISHAAERWLALDKPVGVPILSNGMGYPHQSRFEYACRHVSAQDAFRRSAIPAFLRSRIAWKVGSRGVQFFPAPRDGLTAVHLLP